MPKQSEVLAARQKWIEFLKNPHRRKLEGKLGNEGGERCCLGHGCYILLGPPKVGGPWDPKDGTSGELAKAVGLYSSSGTLPKGYIKVGEMQYRSLTELNDDSDWSPQRIGKYLETVINGGVGTPFRPISDFKK